MPSNKSHYLGHRARLKQRLNTNSSEMAEYELLELLLGYVILRKDTKPLAKELIKHFGSIRGALDALPAEVDSIPHFSQSIITYWKLLREIFARYAETPVREKIYLCTPEAVAEMAKVRFTGCPHEEVWIATVDAQNRLISWERLTKGTVSSSSLYPRDAIEIALKKKASGFILVHNHPGGSTHASKLDIEVTRHIEYVAKIMNVRLLDHIIVTDKNCYSIRRDALL